MLASRSTPMRFMSMPAQERQGFNGRWGAQGQRGSIKHLSLVNPKLFAAGIDNFFATSKKT